MILCLETATTNCSVALFNEGNCIAFKENATDGYSHNEQLHEFIKDVMSIAKVEMKALKAIAVSKGPGSYTGLRIGVSCAKGLCYALSIPLIAIETLTVLSQMSPNNTTYIIPMIDARRMEVYTAVIDQNGVIIERAFAEILTDNSFAKFLKKGSVTFIGDGVDKWEKHCKNLNSVFLSNVLPSARFMGELAHKQFMKRSFEDLAYFEPYYLKDFHGSK